ncbi:MAG: glycerol kinase [Deltaproteobacteria bacterium GWA2_38_16]|nr:MAG: glycerol kinase [Deltaproteobacteria bacterium GWA2_38_16]OGQ01753.1 MAG: glycerol kinase [Deltaproteobacteria bacterium RIFCSPHIGHO2_02_FULL_38_15]OGQ33434.1 MAG: glycerol kinase [Deltaproteobacteria bacterium RIFCSPLOWO2_01_FULL_38_9]HBQ21444.1 glycerol kinase [Deltaproteobacteria bacterium]
MSSYILALDQGTTGSTALLIDQALTIKAKANQEFPQYYPKPGWVEHNLNEIWTATLNTIQTVLKESQVPASQIAAIGITNQRETTCLWDRKSGQPLFPAIVWQCRRTKDICDKLKKQGKEKLFRKKTGLVLDPYFSGTKIKWYFDTYSELYKKDISFGTIDTFLVSKLTQNKVHVTDPSNASRTLLMNLETLEWDEELLDILHVPKNILPLIQSSSEIYGKTKNVPGLPDGIPISGIAGDQQAALFGQACFNVGEAKCTYGTGSFLLLNTGSKIIRSHYNLLTTVAWKLSNKVTYALEGSAFIAGAAVQWLRDGLKIIQKSSDIEALAKTVSSSEEVVFVPALTGLGAPYWNASARGIISGITRGTTAGHLARATLEGIAFQNYDLLIAMQKDLGKKLSSLKVDGGASVNNLLMQFQADLLQTPVIRPKFVETTALGAGCLAGLAIGFWKDLSDIQKSWQKDEEFSPQMKSQERTIHLDKWKSAIRRCL